jgi:hypothetical protein
VRLPTPKNLWPRSGVGLVGALFLSFLTATEMSLSSNAGQPTHKQLMAACKAKYGKNVVSLVVNKDRSVTCQVGVAREMTRAEVYEACKKKYHATSIMLVKKKNGWLCRYHGLY